VNRHVAILVNGAADGAMGQRAAAFAVRLAPRWDVVVACRAGSRGQARRRMQAWLADERPDVVYVLDMGVSGVAAALWHRRTTRTPVVVDTGDAITALARRSGTRSLPGIAATALLERVSLRAADHIVVRGTVHQELLARQGIEATVIPDGVDTRVFLPGDRTVARAALHWPGDFTVAVVGSSVWNPKLGMAYGWDLVELLADVRALPIRGVIVGDGSGLPHLRARAESLGVLDRLTFTGRQPLAAIPRLLQASDVCLSTQTNDVVGAVRTTGKLPLYMACGAFVLASAVGEAARVLPPEMLVPYHGAGRDDGYPARLAARVRELYTCREQLTLGIRNVDVARREFDYDVLADKLDALLHRIVVRAAA
jgi:glycosyltransferase involved in cell wall biosynthesis